LFTPTHSVANDVTYYPPPLARQIIANATTGPAGAKVPAPKEAFLSFAYHVLYHKGLSAGVPSTLSGIKVNTHPENDYAGVLKRMAGELGIEVEITMEALDNFLEYEGWRPKVDTLAKIASRNKWVRRFFATKPGEELGLGVFILRKKTLTLNIVERIVKDIAAYENFKVLKTKLFTEDEIAQVATHLRGGVWNDESSTKQEFLPAMAIVVLDMHLACSTKLGLLYPAPEKRIKILKKILRRKFDVDKVSLVHSTDNTHEAWEYIAWCFPGEIEEVKRKVSRIYESLLPSRIERVHLYMDFLPQFLKYHFLAFKRGVIKYLIH
jgi:hypothetical protein